MAGTAAKRKAWKLLGTAWEGFVPRWDNKKHTVHILETMVSTAQRECERAEGVSPGELHALRHALRIVKQAKRSQWKPQRFLKVIWKFPR